MSGFFSSSKCEWNLYIVTAHEKNVKENIASKQRVVGRAEHEESSVGWWQAWGQARWKRHRCGAWTYDTDEVELRAKEVEKHEWLRKRGENNIYLYLQQHPNTSRWKIWGVNTWRCSKRNLLLRRWSNMSDEEKEEGIIECLYPQRHVNTGR